MKALEIKSLSKNFGGLTVLRDISFWAENGERVAIIGPNGAGKTTLFNIISGTLPADNGEVWILGKNACRLRPYQRARLGMARTFQRNNLFFGLTLRENIHLARRGKPITADLAEFLETWNMKDKQAMRVEELAYGEQRQVELVLALVQAPHLILLDEPTAGMSPAETDAMAGMIRGLSRGITILIIEHDMDIVFELCDRIMVLHNGTIIGDGKPGEVKANPRVREVYLGIQNEGG